MSKYTTIRNLKRCLDKLMNKWNTQPSVKVKVKVIASSVMSYGHGIIHPSYKHKYYIQSAFVRGVTWTYTPKLTCSSVNIIGRIDSCSLFLANSSSYILSMVFFSRHFFSFKTFLEAVLRPWNIFGIGKHVLSVYSIIIFFEPIL